MPDGFDVAVRWAACLAESLLSTAARIAADDAMRARASDDPDWAAAVFGTATTSSTWTRTRRPLYMHGTGGQLLDLNGTAGLSVSAT